VTDGYWRSRKGPHPCTSAIQVFPGQRESALFKRWIAHTPDMYTEQGVTARRIKEVTGRHDEPNIRSSLDGMIRRGFAELVPGHTRPLRFRMTERFRKEGAPAE